NLQVDVMRARTIARLETKRAAPSERDGPGFTNGERQRRARICFCASSALPPRQENCHQRVSASSFFFAHLIAETAARSPNWPSFSTAFLRTSQLFSERSAIHIRSQSSWLALPNRSSVATAPARTG